MIVEWDLKSESTPRCMTTVRPTIGGGGSSGIGNSIMGGDGRRMSINSNKNNNKNMNNSSISTNPFDNNVILDNTGTNSTAATTNTTTSGSMMMSGDDPTSTNSNNNSNSEDGNEVDNIVGLLYGTERGSWHYRIYQKKQITTTNHNNIMFHPNTNVWSSNPTTTIATSNNNNNNNNNNIGSHSMDDKNNNNTSSWVLLSHLSADSKDQANASTMTTSNDYNNNNRISSSYPIVGMVSSSSCRKSWIRNNNNNNNSNKHEIEDVLDAGTSSANWKNDDVEEVMIWMDGHRGPSSQSGAYPAQFLCIHHHHHNNNNSNDGRTHIRTLSSSSSNNLLRVSTATYSSTTGFVYAAGTLVQSVSPDILPSQLKYDVQFHDARLPSPGARSGSGMSLICQHRVAIVAVGNSFFAVPSTTNNNKTNNDNNNVNNNNNYDALKLASFAQSSQVHPAIVVSLEDNNNSHSHNARNSSRSTTVTTSHPQSTIGTIFLANGRECAALIVEYHPDTTTNSSTSSTPASVSDVLSASPPIHGMAKLPSPILSAVAITTTNNYNNNKSRRTTYVACLTSDGLIQFRSPSCIAIPLKTIEIGNRPNDYYFLSTTNASTNNCLLAGSYSGRIKYLSSLSQMFPESKRVTADRIMKLSIDALGPNGFPRTELASALQATFSATNYNLIETTIHNNSNINNNGLLNKQLLLQYLKAGLGLTEYQQLQQQQHSHQSHTDNSSTTSTSLTWTQLGWKEEPPSSPSSHSINNNNSSNDDGVLQNLLPFAKSTLLCGTALLTLVCSSMVPPQSSLALRAAKSCATQIPVIAISNNDNKEMEASCVQVCIWIANKLVSQSKQNMIDLSSHHNQSVNNSKSLYLDFIETAVWLLRSCGQHSTAMQIWSDHLNNKASNNSHEQQSLMTSFSLSTILKYQSYTANHLAELWSSQYEPFQVLVLKTRVDIVTQLLEDNAQLGLSVFTMTHPQNETQWQQLQQTDDPLASNPQLSMQVVQLLKSVQPKQNNNNNNFHSSSNSKEMNSKRIRSKEQHDQDPNQQLPLTTGRALAVAYLESAMGISTNRPFHSTFNEQTTNSSNLEEEELLCDLCDELSYLLLEGIIAERNANDDDDNNGDDSMLGWLYRAKLRRLLSWPNAKIRSERLLESLPTSFKREQALLLGRLGRHDDALRILYNDLNSLDLALQYCDSIHQYRQKALTTASTNQQQHTKKTREELQSCAYLPLVRVALDLDNHGEKGISAAIQVLSLRRSSIDRAAALRMLPRNVPMSSVARPFLIPAMIDGESQVRRLTVAASLLRAKYLHLKRKLTEAQIQSQATITSVPIFKTLPLGDILYSSKPFRVRPLHHNINSSSGTNHNNNYFPDITVIKHFFHRYLILQAKITNLSSTSSTNNNNNNTVVSTTSNGSGGGSRTLTDVSFVVAESSDEALLPSLVVALPTLPSKVTGSCWCVLATSPQRLDGTTAILTCELRYSLTTVDTVTGAPLNFTSNGRSFVEELQDLEIHPCEFEI